VWATQLLLQLKQQHDLIETSSGGVTNVIWRPVKQARRA
jgi:hypothetical protein